MARYLIWFLVIVLLSMVLDPQVRHRRWSVIEGQFGYARCLGVWGNVRCFLPQRPNATCDLAPDGGMWTGCDPVGSTDRVQWARRLVEEIDNGWTPWGG